MKELLPILLISSLFLTLILVGVIILAFHIKGWTSKRDVYYNQRLLEMSDRVDKVEALFKKEITGLLSAIKKVIKIP